MQQTSFHEPTRVTFQNSYHFPFSLVGHFGLPAGPTACGIAQLTDQKSNPHPLSWKQRVLTTGLPGKSLILLLDFCFTCSLLVNCTSSSVAYFHILFLTTFLVRSSLISLSKISDSPTFYLLTSFFLLLLFITTYIVSYASLCFLSLKQVINNKWTVIYCFIYIFFYYLLLSLPTYQVATCLSVIFKRLLVTQQVLNCYLQQKVN